MEVRVALENLYIWPVDNLELCQVRISLTDITQRTLILL